MRYLSLDPLLFYLHQRGRGSWQSFRAAVERFDTGLDAWNVATVLAENAAVEFDWDSTRAWSVTPSNIVVWTREGVTRWSLWGGTFRSAVDLAKRGVLSEIGERRAFDARGRGYSYRHAVAIDFGARAEALAAENFGRWAMFDSRVLIDKLPSMTSLWRRCTRVEHTEDIEERYEPERPFRRRWVRSEFALRPNTLWRRKRRFSPTRFYYCDGSVVRETMWWLGYWLEFARRRTLDSLIFELRSGSLVFPRFPPLPIPFVRGLLLAGGVERDPLVSTRPIRWFSNVSLDVAHKISRCLDLPMSEE